MSLGRIAIAGLAATVLSGTALADDYYYHCNGQLCYDDQADETRRLNELQLENPGAGPAAVPPPRRAYDDVGNGDDEAFDARDSQGGPYCDDEGASGEDCGAPVEDEAYPSNDDAGSWDDDTGGADVLQDDTPDDQDYPGDR
jgi:hypothetical protein